MMTLQTNCFFYYTTVAQLRLEGIPLPPTGPTNETIQRSILRNSTLINNVTKQWFQPVKQDVKVSGDGGRYLRHPYLLPVIDVSCIYALDLEGTRTSLYMDNIRIDGRHIGKFYQNDADYTAVEYDGVDDEVPPQESRPTFYKGLKNYEISGVFGVIEKREKVETVTTLSKNVGDTQIKLDSTENLYAGDSLMIGGQHFFINTIIDATTVGIDPSYAKIQAGVSAVKYGIVPFDIQRAVGMLVVDDALYGLASEEEDNDEFKKRLKHEVTDNYSYTLATSRAEESAASLSRGGTGNLKVDAILSRYLPPRMIAWV